MFGEKNYRIAVCVLYLLSCTLYLSSMTAAQDVMSDEKIIERYKLMLSRKPKEGSTFDRLYQFYLEGARLEQMVADYRREATAQPENPNLQLILGHIYKRLGKDEEMLTAYQRAVELAPDDYYPHFALGQAYATLRRHEAAIETLTNAAELSTASQTASLTDLTALYKALGHAYFGRGRVGEAISAWGKIAEIDPKNIFARIELADLFREQKLHTQAIEQHEAIIQLKTDDPYRVCLSRRTIGQIQEENGDYQDAIRSYDAALALTAPGNWLRKDIQKRIIGIYATKDDWGGLIRYYEAKLMTTPNNPELIGLLASAYIQNQQFDAGIAEYRKGLALAPTDVDLRLNLIAALRDAGKFEEAAAEYETLREQSPDDLGIYRELGALYLQLKDEKRARGAYQRMIDRDPDNPRTHLLLAEIYVEHEWIADAIAEYEQAISLAPDNLDYIEYFGEFYFRQGNRERSVEIWKRMVAEDRAIAENYERLALLLDAKHFHTEAIAASRKAVALKPDEYRYREALARQLMENKAYEEALTQYTEAAKLAPNAFFAEQMADQQLEIYRHQGTLVEKIEALESAPETFDQQKQLAKMYRKLGNITSTMKALLKAKGIQPDNVRVNRWLADIYVQQNMRDEATTIYAHLIEIDSANAREYYAGISRSHLKVMAFDAATDAARQVVAHSPHNPEGYQMLAEIAKHAGNYDAAVDSIKQVIRLRPEATDIRAELAEIYKLAGNLRQAVEQYWRCWELSNNVTEKLGFVRPLFETYDNMEQSVELEERLAQMSKANPSDMGPVLALAQVYRIKKDLSSARYQLMRGLELEHEKPELLAQLVQMSLELGDMQGALDYQQRLVKAQPNPFNQQRLGELLYDMGRTQEAIQVWTQLLYTKNQTVEAELRLANVLIQHVLLDEAFSALERAGQKAKDAKAIYQVGAMFAGMNAFDRAQPYFERILQMPKPSQNTTQNVIGHSRRLTYGPPGINAHKFKRVQSIYPLIQMQIFRGEMLKQLKTELQTNGSLRSKMPQGFRGSIWQPWTPNSFEEARAGALVQLMIIAQWQGQSREFIQQLEADADANPRDILTLERLAQLYILTDNSDKTKEITERLIAASPNDPVYHGMRLNQSMQENLDYETVKKYVDEMAGVALQTRLWYIAQYARRLYLQQKKTEAVELLDEFRDAEVTDPNTTSQLVRVFAEMGKIDTAERLIAQLPNQGMSAVSQTSVLDKDTHLYLARAYERRNIIDKAIKHYKRVSELDPNRVRWYVAITRLYQKQHSTAPAKQLAKTAALYEKALNTVPSSFELHYLLATTYGAQNRFSEATGLYRRALNLALKTRERNMVLRSIWKLYAGSEQQDKGIAILEELKGELQTDLVLHELLGNAYKAVKNFEKAEGAYTEWLVIRQKSVHRKRARDYRDLAGELLDKNILPEKALAFAERAAQIGTSHHYASMLGRAYLANGRYEEALEQFKHGINSMNHPGMAAEDAARQLYLAASNVTDKARYIAMVEELMSTLPDNPTLQQLAALVEYYRKQEQPDKAKDATRQ